MSSVGQKLQFCLALHTKTVLFFLDLAKILLSVCVASSNHYSLKTCTAVSKTDEWLLFILRILMFRNCPRTSQTMRSLSCSHVDFQSNLIKWPAVLFFFQALFSKIIRIFFVFPGVHRYLIVYLHLKTKLMPTVTESPWSIKKNPTLVSDCSSVGDRIL